MMFNPLREIAYAIKNALTKNTEFEIAADFTMSLGEIHICYNYHCSQTNSQLLWDENGGIYWSKLRKDGMPSAETGPFGALRHYVACCLAVRRGLLHRVGHRTCMNHGRQSTFQVFRRQKKTYIENQIEPVWGRADQPLAKQWNKWNAKKSSVK